MESDSELLKRALEALEETREPYAKVLRMEAILHIRHRLNPAAALPTWKDIFGDKEGYEKYLKQSRWMETREQLSRKSKDW